MSFIQTHFTALAFLFLLGFRIAMASAIQAGNAPDEVGHMLMVISFAQGKYLTLQESLELSRYPYPIYNPLGYFPSAFMVWMGSVFHLVTPVVSKPFYFTALENFLARLGMQFWSVLFIFFFIQLLRKQSFEKKLVLCLCVGVVPQLVFVQSYVNLDSCGMAVFLYLLWGALEKKEGHLTFATFLLGCCKMNFFCLFLIPLFYIWQAYGSDKVALLKKIFTMMVVPGLLASTWFVFSYFVNTRQYGKFFGFNALPEIYQAQKSGFRVFSLDFLNISLNSALGRFGWMSIRIPEVLTFPWRVIILPAGVYFLVGLSRKKEHPHRRLAQMALAVVIANFGVHYWGSFNNDFQPQGRYILPAILILLVCLSLRLKDKWQKALCIFMLVSSLVGIGLASKTIPNPPGLALQSGQL